MKTPNTLHKVRCSADGCPDEALVTIPCPGDSVKGYCANHIQEVHMVRNNAQTLTDAETRLILSLMHNNERTAQHGLR